MTNERDYAAYLALMSSGQGKNGKKALENMNKSLGGQTWPEYCSTRYLKS